ncbi:MAG: hypothetical protein RIB71_11955 [Imperialibacter sp.]|uniref:hypothetical protein n=1 Tax=Imperialibacter sp. TaxID=2038411 RepID=UPI0032EB8542
MRSKTQIKGAIFKVASLPAFKNIVIILGIAVALLVGFFTLHAQPNAMGEFAIDPKTVSSNVRVVGSDFLDVETTPEVIIYDRNLDLILSANLTSISDYEKEHLSRLLKVCDLMFSSDNTTIYQLDK